jgi:hypothetical protein
VVLGFEDFFKAFDVRISGQREQEVHLFPRSDLRFVGTDPLYEGPAGRYGVERVAHDVGGGAGPLVRSRGRLGHQGAGGAARRAFHPQTVPQSAFLSPWIFSR